MNKSNKKEFIKKAQKVHKNKYNYSKVSYINSKIPVKIVCPIHGEFEQKPSQHLYYGCKKCGINSSAQKSRLSINDFIRKAQKIHRNKYDYSKVDYKNNHTKVKIICPIHGEFEQSPSNHLYSKTPCPKCLIQNSTNFILNAKKIHGDKYDYSLVNFKSYTTKVKIICPIHGEFEQTPLHHVSQRYGCFQCGNNKLSTDEFIKKAKEFHGDKYNYSLVNYVNSVTPIIIICPIHGEFEQSPAGHIYHNNGCPKCSTIISKPHQEIIDFISSIYRKEIKINDRETISSELDIYLPHNNIAFEFNGLYYHSYDQLETKKEKFKHFNKLEECIKNNIKLIQIDEQEWNNKRNIVKSMITYLLHHINKICARKCKIDYIDNDSYRKFMNKNHLYGFRDARIKIGLKYYNRLVSVMSLNKHPKYEWEIIRFANEIGTTIVGGASKLFKYFIKNHHPNQVLTYADRRYSDGNLYKKLGFKLNRITKPNYCYIKGNNIFSRQQFQKHKLKDKLEVFNSDFSEAENMFNNGYRRMWDAGHYKFLWNSNEL